MVQIYQLTKTDLIDAIRDVMHEFVAAKKEDYDTAYTEAVMLTRGELCDRWHISMATLNNYQRAGRIKPTRLGGRRVLYALADVLRAEAKTKNGKEA